MKLSFCILALAALASAAHALINVRFTPVDLARDAREIFQLEVSPPSASVATAKISATLKGKPAAPALTIDLSAADDQTLENFPKTGGIGLLFTGDFSKAASTDPGGEKPAAVLQIGTQWFALSAKEQQWRLGKDPLDLSAVWGGSAAMLAECVKYCLADARADVPTTAGAKFASDELLGKVPGPVTRIDVYPNGRAIVRASDSDQEWQFPAKTFKRLATAKVGATRELVTDYDGDGVLDKLVAQTDGPRLLRAQKTDMTEETGELDYHSRSKPELGSVGDCDVNCDGRPDLLLVYAKGLPALVFFNRGFGCFGLGRELLLQDSELPAAKALADGQQAAAFVDVNGDDAPDLLAVAPNGELWVLYTALDRKPGPSVTVTATEPLTVTGKEGARSLGARQVGPGLAATFWLKNPGPLDLEWGSGQKKRMIATKPVSVELSPAK